MPLKEIRTKIEKIDAQILSLIDQRTALAKDVLDARRQRKNRSMMLIRIKWSWKG